MLDISSPPRRDLRLRRGLPPIAHRLIVAVAVAGEIVPAWHAACIDALRSLDGVDVRVVTLGTVRWRPLSGFAAFAGGPAMAPARIALDGGELSGADVVIDLADARPAVDPPFGLWAFRLGRGAEAVPCAREAAAGDATFRIELVRRGSRGARLRSGRFGITYWFPSTLRVALGEAARWPATCVAAVRDGVALEAVPDEAPEPATPRRRVGMLALGAGLASRFGGMVIDTLSEVVEWNVGFVEGGPRAVLSGEPLRVRWLPQPAPLTFLADPFLVERDGLRVLFVEEFSYERNRGVIDALVLDELGAVTRRVRALDLATHLSYPYPVEVDGELYLMPENCAAREVALYRCVRFPDLWERETVVLPFDAVDTTMFAHEGRWWAFCTRYSHGSTLALHAFHAASPRGPWEPHALNPIVVDVACARPGGTPFVVDGVLYRPGQDCTHAYGAGVVIARVDELTPTAYRETVVRRLDGREFGRYADGVHTVSVCGETVAVDGKHVYRDPRKLLWAVRRMRERFARHAPVPAVAPRATTRAHR